MLKYLCHSLGNSRSPQKALTVSCLQIFLNVVIIDFADFREECFASGRARARIRHDRLEICALFTPNRELRRRNAVRKMERYIINGP